MSNWRIVEHEPRWEPVRLPINAAGDTKPGFMCIHELENGNGLCGGNVFDLDEAIGTHACAVHSDEPERDQYKRRYDELLATMQGGATAKTALRTMTAARDQLSKELARDEARYEEIIGDLNDRIILQLKRAGRAEAEVAELEGKLLDSLRRECGALCTDMERDRDEWERRATEGAELAKATREKLREAHNELHELVAYLHKREQRLEDARSRLATYEVWDDSVPPGGYVCAACGVPVESEPCAEHWKGPVT